MLKILHYLYFSIACPLFFIITMLFSVILIIGVRVGGGSKFIYWCGSTWGKVGLFILLCPIKVEGKENLPNNKGPFVVMANHQGGLDILMMYGYLPMDFRWVMKAALRKVPFMGKACEVSGFVFVDPSKPVTVAKSMQEARNVLSQGKSIFIFPEGSRTRDGKMARFKRGGFVMAYDLDVPIIPITINGSYEAYPKSRKLYVRPTKLKLTIHKPFEFNKNEETQEAISGAMEEVYSIISSACIS